MHSDAIFRWTSHFNFNLVLFIYTKNSFILKLSQPLLGKSSDHFIKPHFTFFINPFNIGQLAQLFFWTSQRHLKHFIIHTQPWLFLIFNLFFSCPLYYEGWEFFLFLSCLFCICMVIFFFYMTITLYTQNTVFNLCNTNNTLLASQFTVNIFSFYLYAYFCKYLNWIFGPI